MNHNKNIKTIFELIPNSRLVGGCVRDSILGITPKDYDFATTFLPEEIIDICSKNGVEVVPTGLHHGTVSIILDGVAYEITTLRKDTNTDGRHAEVVFHSSWEEDAARRDFTFNALYSDKSGKIYDYYDGIADLKNREVRFIGSASDRIREDYLRILRYFRFSGRFNSTRYNQEAINAISELKDNINSLSVERINSELEKICSHSSRWNILEKMVDTGVFSSLFNKDIDFSIYKDKGVDYLVIYSLIEKYTNSLLNKLKLSKEEESNIKIILDKKYIMWYQTELEIQKLGQIYSKDEMQYKLEYSNLWNTSNIYETVELINNTEIPKFPVSGSDLIQEGFQQGKELGLALKKLKSHWINSDFKLGRKELLKLLI